MLSPAFFIAIRSDQSGQEGKCRSACSCLCGTSNIPACLSYQQTGTHRSLRLAVPGQSKSLCSCVLFHLCHSLRQSLKKEDRSKSSFTPSLFTWSSSSLNSEPCGWFWSPEGLAERAPWWSDDGTASVWEITKEINQNSNLENVCQGEKSLRPLYLLEVRAELSLLSSDFIIPSRPKKPSPFTQVRFAV